MSSYYKKIYFIITAIAVLGSTSIYADSNNGYV